jgi:hypothetical protein
VSRGQSTFIRERSIHDNFQYVQGAIRHFHRSKTSMLFIKLDITKAFNSVRWEYLLEVLKQLGFSQRWRDILSLLWSTSSSRILLNGTVGGPIKHGRSLRQGDSLSPLLFILVIDPLQQLLDMATDRGLLHPISAEPVKLRTSMYVEDTALFIRPKASDVENLQQLL